MDIKELFGLNGKKVVITGAASGMGRAATELLIELGAEVHAIDMNPIDLPVAKAYQANLGEKESIDKLVEELPNGIEAYFSCHGIAHKEGREMLVSKVNFLGQKYMAELLADKINENGSITFISSAFGFGWEPCYGTILDLIAQPTWEDSVKWYEEHSNLIIDKENPNNDYAFSKQCIQAYVVAKVHDPKYISKKIRINSICPGITETGLSDDFRRAAGAGDMEAGENVMVQTFMASWNGYAASPEHMGYPLVVLGSKISSYISGQNLYIDYGVTSTWTHGALTGNLTA